MKHSNLSPELTRELYKAIGLKLPPSNDERLTKWLDERCFALMLPSPEAYVKWLSEPSHLQQEREALYQLLISRESYFLRDRGVVDVIREHILKETITRKMSERSLNIWSVGCSTGEEAYTLSILLEEAILELSRWHVDILGSDIDQTALNQARQGIYRQWSFRGCPPEFVSRYFWQEDSQLKIMTNVKQRVRFEQLDIVGGAYPTEYKGMAHADIILCRNVFIYLDDAAIQTALKKITACLNEGGYLLCGPGELHLQAHPQLVPLIFPQALVYQKKSMVDQKPIAMPLPSPSIKTDALTKNENTSPTKQSSKKIEPLASLDQAWVLANRGNIAAANAICRILIRQDHLDPHAHYLQAVLDFAQGLTAQARDALRRVLYLDPAFAVAYVMLSDVCTADQDTDCALKACKQGLRATSHQPEEQAVPYFKSVTYLELRQHLQERISSLSQ